MESHNCSEVVLVLKRYYLTFSYSLIFSVGLVGNLTSICIYLTRLRPWRSSSVLLFNLALTDLLYVLSLPFLVHSYATDSWPFGEFMCLAVRFWFHFNLYGSVLSLTCLALFRYAVVSQPLRAAQLQEKSWGVAACSAVWTLTTAQVAPMLGVISFEGQGNGSRCLDFASSTSGPERWYGWVLTGLGFLLPLLVVCLSYAGIVRQLASGPSTTTPRRRRARRVTVLILLVFVVCFLPYHVLRTLRIETNGTPESACINAVYIASRPLAALNTFFNLVLYTLSGDRFREAVLRAFNCKRGLARVRELLRLSRPEGGVTSVGQQL